MWIFDVLLVALVVLSLLVPYEREKILKRSRGEWLVDTLALATHFLVLPALSLLLVYRLYELFIPSLKGSLSVGWTAALLINMAVDYCWYWNHRLFHAETPLWNFHAVHHEPKHLDVLASSRNTFWSPFLMVYFWFQPLAAFVAIDKTPFLAIAGFGLVVNFWGHTSF